MKYKILSLFALAGLLLSSCNTASSPFGSSYISATAPCSEEEALYFMRASRRLTNDIDNMPFSYSEKVAALRMASLFLMLGIMETDSLTTNQKCAKLEDVGRSAKKLTATCRKLPSYYWAAGERPFLMRYRQECKRADIRLKQITRHCMERHNSKRLAKIICDYCDALQL